MTARSWPSRRPRSRGYRGGQQGRLSRRSTTRATRTSTWRRPSSPSRRSRARPSGPKMANKAAYDGLTEFEEAPQALAQVAAAVGRTRHPCARRALPAPPRQRRLPACLRSAEDGRPDRAGRGRDAPAAARAEVLVRCAQGPDPLLAGHRRRLAPQALARGQDRGDSARGEGAPQEAEASWRPSSRRRRRRRTPRRLRFERRRRRPPAKPLSAA